MPRGEPKSTLLRQHLTERGWLPYDTFRRHFESAAAHLASERDEPDLASLSVSRTQYMRWLSGNLTRAPYPLASLVLEHMFHTNVQQLLASSTTSGVASADEARRPGPTLHNLESEITMSGHESSEHAASASRSVDDTSIEQLQEDIAKIARRYPFNAVYQSFADARRVRDLGYTMLDRTAVPAQETDLYMVIGQACGILATAVFDLGYPDTAAEHARSAYVYGKMIGHPGLCAWSLGMRALICYWNKRPYESLDLIGKGLALAPEGTAALRLRAIQARAFAHLGDATGTADAARLAHEQAESESRDLVHDQVGGEFSFDDARLARCLGSAWVQLGAADQGISESRTALELYSARPQAIRMPKVEAEAHIDLAHAYLLQGSLEAAEESLTTVFEIAPESRIEGVTTRLTAVHDQLARTEFRGTRRAVQLARQIEDFIPARDALPAIGPGE